MVGRNEPCPCGSGKKYKACCLKKQNVVSVSAPIKNELKDIIDRFGQRDGFSNNMREMNKWKAKQTVNLNRYYSPVDAKFIYFDAYSFMYQLESWRAYIDREIKKALRPAVKTLLEKWRKPKYMLLHIKEVHSNVYRTTNVLTGETIEVEKDNILLVNVGDYILGPFLNSSIESPTSYFSINLIVISSINNNLKSIWWIKSAYAKSKWQSEDDFFYENLLVCYEMIGKKDWAEENPLSEKEGTLLETLTNELIALDLNFAEIVPVITNYMQVEGFPKRMKKQESFLAGAVLAGETLGFYEFCFQRKYYIDYFGVSASTANKYENMILDFYDRHSDELRKPIMAIVQGTDPSSTEYEQWTLMMQMRDKDFHYTSERDLTEEINKLRNEPYIPKNEKEMAQKLAYESYFASAEFKKVYLANEAWDTDPKNPDALLLRAEFVKDVQEQRAYIKQAIRWAEEQLDDSMDNPWAYILNRPYMRAVCIYGLSYFEEGQYEKALKQFEKLLVINKNDNQGVRYLAVVCYLKLGLLDKAEQLLMEYHHESDAMTMWLHWALLKQKGEGTEKVEKAWDKAYSLNPFVGKYMYEKQTPIHYPKSLMMKRQSSEEGQMIWYLLHHLVHE